MNRNPWERKADEKEAEEDEGGAEEEFLALRSVIDW